MRNIRLFDEYSDFLATQEAVSGSGKYVEDIFPGFAYTRDKYSGETYAYYNGHEEEEIGPDTPLTFVMRGDGVYTIGKPHSNWGAGPLAGDVMHYSINGGPWQDYTYEYGNSGWEYLDITVHSGDTIAFKGRFPDRTYGDFCLVSYGDDTPSYDVYGNIMSIVDEDNYAQMTEFPEEWTRAQFANMFTNAPVIDASRLYLPLTYVPAHGYQNMFMGSTIENLPPLHCTGVSYSSSLAGMFSDCENLREVPEDYLSVIEHIIGAEGHDASYFQSECGTTMFSGCINLEVAPILPAIPELVEYSNHGYDSIFDGCVSLGLIRSLYPGNGSNSESVYKFGLNNDCADSGILEVPAETVANVTGVPTGWTVRAIQL